MNRYKDKYTTLPGGNSVACSYCHDEIETEMHLYVECEVTGEFWRSASYWFSEVFKVTPTLALKGPRLFGQEERPSGKGTNATKASLKRRRRKKTLI